MITNEYNQVRAVMIAWNLYKLQLKLNLEVAKVLITDYKHPELGIKMLDSLINGIEGTPPE